MYDSVLAGNNKIFEKTLIKIYNLQKYKQDLGKPSWNDAVPWDYLHQGNHQHIRPKEVRKENGYRNPERWFNGADHLTGAMARRQVEK